MTWTTRQRSEIAGHPAIVAGQGPVVLLLHGVGLRAEAWGSQIDALAGAGFRVIAPDMIGHGAAAPSGAASLEDFVAPVRAMVDGPAVVVGHSMGAMMALALGSEVQGVVAMNAVYRRSDAARAAVAARVASLDGQKVADPEPTLARWFGTAPSEARHASEQWLRDADPAGYRAAYTVFAAEDGPEDAALAGLRCPALFLTGGEEPNSTPEMSQAMAALAPQGRCVVVEGAAHMLPMTHAAVVNAVLVEFAERCLR